MTDKKLTDNEIKKALECCSKDDCDNCPNDFGNCYSNLSKFALDYINRLEAENERLQKYHDDMESAICSFREDDAKVKFLKRQIKAEAHKEFAERLKEEATKMIMMHNDIPVKTDYQISGDNIDNLLKEMVGDE